MILYLVKYWADKEEDGNNVACAGSEYIAASNMDDLKTFCKEHYGNFIDNYDEYEIVVEDYCDLSYCKIPCVINNFFDDETGDKFHILFLKTDN